MTIILKRRAVRPTLRKAERSPILKRVPIRPQLRLRNISVGEN